MRLIDADAVDYENIMCSLRQLEWLNTIIEKQPTIDAVPVVRCKDCKHGEVDEPEDFPDQYCCHCGHMWNEGYYFCADGERKDNAVD